MRAFIKRNERILKAILIVIFYSLLPMIGLIFYMTLGQREIVIKLVKNTASNRLKEIVLIENELVTKTETFLFMLSQIDRIEIYNKDKCNIFLPNLLKKSNYFRNIFVADLQGNVYCSAVPIKGKINVKDRKYFGWK